MLNLIPEPHGVSRAVTNAFIHEAFTGLAARIAARFSVCLGQYQPARLEGHGWGGNVAHVGWHLGCWSIMQENQAVRRVDLLPSS